MKISRLNLIKYVLVMIAIWGGLGGSAVFAATGNNNPDIIAANTSDYDVAYPGTIAPAFYFTLRADAVALNINKITINNNTSTIAFGTGDDEIQMVSIYKDDGDDEWDSGDTLLGQTDFTTSTTGSVNIDINPRVEVVASTGEIDIFVVYHYGDTVTIGSQAGIEIESVFSEGTGAGTGTLSVEVQTTSPGNDTATTSSTINIAGATVLMNAALTIPDVTPGDSDKLMGQFDITASSVEGVIVETITIANASNNFDMISFDENGDYVVSDAGVTKVKLYKDSGGAGSITFESSDTLIQTISNDPTEIDNSLTTTMDSKIQLTFNINESINSGTTETYFITYDIGENTNIQDEDDEISFQIIDDGITGIGESTTQETSFFSNGPSLRVTANIFGLSYTETGLQSIVSDTNVIGAGMTSPVFKFELEPHQVDVTVNQISLQNTGTIEYKTSSAQTDKVSKIFVYKDDSFTEIVASLNLTGNSDISSGGTNTWKEAVIPFDTNVTITEGNSQFFYIAYEFGVGVRESSDAEGNNTSYANGNLSGATAISIISGVSTTISLTGTLPSVVSPDAKVEIKDINIKVDSVETVGPSVAMEGEIKLPVLAITLDSEQAVASATVVIKNAQATFKADNTGINKVWVFRDKGTIGVLDDEDEFLTASTDFSEGGQKVTISGVGIPESSSFKLLIAYDIGMNAFGTEYAAQLDEITVGDDISVVLGGDFPLPKAYTTPDVKRAQLDLTKVVVSESNISNLSSNFTVEVGVRNNIDKEIKVINVSPRFYLSGIDGKDMSYEFEIIDQNPSLYPKDIAVNTVTTFNFTVNPSNIQTEGTLYVDAVLEYIPTTNTTANYELPSEYYNTYNVTAIRQRYLEGSNDWEPGAVSGSQIPRIFITTSNKAYDFTVPRYVTIVEVEVGGANQWQIFQSRQAIPTNTRMRITIMDNGRHIDESSIQLSLNGVSYIKESNAFGDQSELKTYKYIMSTIGDDESGTIIINDVGNTDGTIQLTLSDFDGNVLEQSSWEFYINQVLQIDQFLFYPNPYSPDVTTTLKIGFSITKAATVEIFIYNSMGREVARLPKTSYSSLGYNIIDFNTKLSTGKYFASGIYIAKIVAIDVDGKKAYSVSKLAVY